MSEVDHTWWYLNRASGIVAYMLLFGCVFLGLSMTGGFVERVVRRFRVYDLHRFVALLALSVSIFHVAIVLPDRYIGFSAVDLTVPFASPYEPLFTALGIFSLYLLAVIVGAFYIRSVISYRGWRLLHYTTFAAFGLALAHGIGAGTDTEAAWLQYTYASTGLVAFNLLVYRLVKGGARAGLSPATTLDGGSRAGGSPP